MEVTPRNDVMIRAALYKDQHVREAYHLEPDSGEEFCEDCAQRELQEGHADRIVRCDQFAHYNSPPCCARCHCWLAGWLTDWGAAEVLASLEAGFDPQSDQDCYLWELCANNYTEDSEEYGRLLRLLERKGRE